jgi:hypothetical protein
MMFGRMAAAMKEGIIIQRFAADSVSDDAGD